MKKVLPILGVGLLALYTCSACAGRCPSQADKYQVYATTPQPNSATTPSYYVRAGVAPLILDSDDMTLIVVPLGVANFVVGVTTSTGGYFAQYISTLPAVQVPPAPAATAADLGFTTTTIATQAGGCPSIVLEKPDVSFMVEFNADGSILRTQSLSTAALGVDISKYVNVKSDINGDGRQDIMLVENGAARLALLAGGDGTLTPDPATSATAVIQGFFAACAAANRALAASYLGGNALALYGSEITNTANDITQLAPAVIKQTTVKSSQLVNVQIAYNNPGETVIYSYDIARIGGLWYIQSL